jgi:site-specific recombinase XerD
MTVEPALPATSVVRPARLAGDGHEILAQELVLRASDELPRLAELSGPDQLLVAAWLISLRSARTRRAYFADLRGWREWLAMRGTVLLGAGRVHVDLWVAGQTGTGAEGSSVRRRLSAVSSFYRYAAGHGLLPGPIPTDGVTRPVVDPDYTATVSLDRAQLRALITAAGTDTGLRAARTAAAIRLLATTALRVDELIQADIADLGSERGHRVVAVVRKGGRKARLPLPPPTWDAVDSYLAGRAEQAGLGDWRQLAGPLLATANGTAGGGRLRQSHLWELVRRLGRAAGLNCADQLSPHSLRHSAITLALDAGATLRDVQDFAGHKDPRTTRRYDHTRHSLDRSAAYALATYLA